MRRTLAHAPCARPMRRPHAQAPCAGLMRRAYAHALCAGPQKGGWSYAPYSRASTWLCGLRHARMLRVTIADETEGGRDLVAPSRRIAGIGRRGCGPPRLAARQPRPERRGFFRGGGSASSAGRLEDASKSEADRQANSCFEVRAVSRHADANRGVEVRVLRELIRDAKAQGAELDRPDVRDLILRLVYNHRSRALVSLGHDAVLITDAEGGLVVDGQAHAYVQVENATGVDVTVVLVDEAREALGVGHAAEEHRRIRRLQERETALDRIEPRARGNAGLQAGILIDGLIENVRTGVRLEAQRGEIHGVVALEVVELRTQGHLDVADVRARGIEVVVGGGGARERPGFSSRVGDHVWHTHFQLQARGDAVASRESEVVEVALDTLNVNQADGDRRQDRIADQRHLIVGGVNVLRRGLEHEVAARRQCCRLIEDLCRLWRGALLRRSLPDGACRCILITLVVRARLGLVGEGRHGDTGGDDCCDQISREVRTALHRANSTAPTARSASPAGRASPRILTPNRLRSR